ncbi:MAG: hypothetical protein IT544_00030 [Rhodobacteraceae bacterium]|jgi:uncharacterized membrane protein|nr:hypothetical protein [Paracoccaceae bacterium]
MTEEELIGLGLYWGWWLIDKVFSFEGLAILGYVFLYMFAAEALLAIFKDLRDIKFYVKETSKKLEELNRK